MENFVIPLVGGFLSIGAFSVYRDIRTAQKSSSGPNYQGIEITDHMSQLDCGTPSEIPEVAHGVVDGLAHNIASILEHHS
jgi:hypothetical protein